ncbi:hypothetical protein [Pseudomonas sp. dw_358]|uniref:PA0061/PA0062 family lipoprotein n=1 Tax=Pseudomonas sp. dw_358 TaxID=2720083 RepID=UPI001BD5D030|nr:hypothetical protein [Pseudomonas sp. dw_358]
MQSKSLLLVPLLSAVCLLSACAGPMPKADPSEAWIGLRDDVNSVVLAEKVDGQKIADGRFFEVQPGTHDLGVMAYDDGGSDSTLTCTGDIHYSGFKAGHRYRLVESSLGENFSANLVNQNGKTVASSTNFDCMPG